MCSTTINEDGDTSDGKNRLTALTVKAAHLALIPSEKASERRVDFSRIAPKPKHSEGGEWVALFACDGQE